MAGPRPLLPSRTVEQEALSAKRTEEEVRGFQFPILIIVKCLRQQETAAIIFFYLTVATPTPESASLSFRTMRIHWQHNSET